jgi:hypothetical protein
MTYPITMTEGQPMKKQLCYGVVQVKDLKYSKVPGQALRCKPLLASGEASSGSDSVAPASTAPADTATYGFGGGRAMGMMASFGQPQRAIPGVTLAECAPDRVSGLSYFLDAFQTGSSAGPGVFYGIALAVLGRPLPEPFGQYQGQLIAQGGTFVEQFSKDVPAAIAQSREFFAPGAAFNEPANVFVDAFADGLESGAESLGPMIQPGDRSMKEFADAARDFKAMNAPCA